MDCVHPEDTAVFGGPAMPPAVRGAWLSTLTGSLDRVCLMGALTSTSYMQATSTT